MSRAAGLSLVFFALVPGLANSADLPPAAARSIDFARDVRPILDRSCRKCHGGTSTKGGLSLDSLADAVRGGDNGPALVPGKLAESRIFLYAAGADEDGMVMPPEGKGDRLDTTQLGVLRAWIEQGADWPQVASGGAAGANKLDHWAFRPPVRPESPPIRKETWVRNPIDGFVLAGLERDGTVAAPEADRTTLIRRLSLDLIGLPPSIAEVDDFLADNRPDAYEQAVDRLLASPHYGERWARRWLDRARYADTNGYEKDRERSIWPYRDWVIDAINRDLPFDQFTVEQLAGDLLPDPTPAQRIATGFHRNTMTNEEGGIDVEEFRFASIVDRVGTTGGTWLGLTIQCAQCHTHKYDPITHRDYYRFFSFFNNADEPEMARPDPATAAKRAAIDAEVARRIAGRADAFPSRDPESDWIAPVPDRLESRSGAALVADEASLVRVSGKLAETDRYRVELTLPPGRYESVGLDLPGEDSTPGPGRTAHGNFVLTDFRLELVAGVETATRVGFAKPSATVEQSGFDVGGAIDQGTKTGWAIDDGTRRLRSRITASFDFAEPLTLAIPTKIVATLGQEYGGGHTLGRFRIGFRRLESGEDDPDDRAARIRHLADRLREWEAVQNPGDWSIAPPLHAVSKRGATMDLRPDGSVLVRGDKPNTDAYEVELASEPEGATGFRLEALTDPSLPDGGPGRAPLFSIGDFFLSEVAAELVSDRGTSRRIKLVAATESYSEPGHPARLAIDGATDTGWTIKGGAGRRHTAVFNFGEPIRPQVDERLRITLRMDGIHQTTLGRFRIALTRDTTPAPASSLPSAIEAILRQLGGNSTTSEGNQVRDHFLSVATELAAYNKSITDLIRSRPEPPTTLVLQERPPSEMRTTHIHKRGEFLQLGDPVEPGVPGVLPPLDPTAPRDRLGLARWIVSSSNPLTARVWVNTEWQAFFGLGIVSTLDDFGTRGEKPTHPELLDWLATEAVRLGWSRKALHRLIVTSATYRQTSRATREMLAKDPRNERLARGPRFRVDAETVRDLALSASGLLNPTIGGPSVYPPQPDGVTSLAYGQAAWPTSKGSARHRRGLYTFTKRAAPYATAGLFDAPGSEATCLRRERSNTPLQALTLLNDPVYLEAALALAARADREVGNASREAKIRRAFRLVMSREPDGEELHSLIAFHADQLDRANRGEIRFGGDSPTTSSPAMAERSALTAVARVILNLDEAISKE